MEDNVYVMKYLSVRCISNLCEHYTQYTTPVSAVRKITELCQNFSALFIMQLKI